MPRVKGGAARRSREDKQVLDGEWGLVGGLGWGDESFKSLLLFCVCCRRAFLSLCEARETLQILKSLHSALGGRLTSAAANEEKTERGDRGEEERQKAKTPKETISKKLNDTDAARNVNEKTGIKTSDRERGGGAAKIGTVGGRGWRV